jgi:hypothetical protein
MEPILEQERLNNTVHFRTIIDAETGTTDGEWFDTAGYEAVSFEFSGVSGETIQIRASNNPEQLTPNDDGVQLGNDISANAIVANVIPVAQMKIMITAGGAGTVTVYFLGVLKKTR